MSKNKESEITESKAREARRRRDHDDLNHERAGLEVGRQRRFLPENANPDEIKKRQHRERERLSALMTLLQNDPEYAALYNETVDLVRDKAAVAQEGVDTAQSALSEAGQQLEAITDKAAKLHPGGEPVFSDKNGNAVRADGTPLTPEDAASVVWPNDAPSYEEYIKANKTYEDAHERLKAWREYQLYIGGIQDRLNDPDNPLPPDELKKIQQEVEDRIPRAGDAETEPRAVQTSSAPVPSDMPPQ